MLRNNQINRLLASIVASMVVLTAVANVEVRLPEHEIEELNSQLRYDCNALMNDRAGQDALGRLLRYGQLNGIKHTKLQAKHVVPHRLTPIFVLANACPPEFYIPSLRHSKLFISITIDMALLAPALASRLHIRAPSS